MKLQEKKATCFISYCYDGIKRDEIDYLVKRLKERHKYFAEYLYDVKLGVGERFDTFMNMLSIVDSVIMIFTPEYKNKITNKKDGVWEEYKQIKERYFEQQQIKKQKESEFRENHFFEIIPILWKGEKDSSIPNEFHNYKYLDFKNFYLVADKKDYRKYVICDGFKNNFDKALREIKSSLETIYHLKTKDYQNNLENVYDKFLINTLFVDNKADFNNPKYSLRGYEKSLFVKTYVYKQVETQSAYFIIGRKGSGKSAISQVLPIRCKDRLAMHIEILTKDINLGSLYNIFNDKFRSDTMYLAKRKECFNYTWSLFFKLNIMSSLIALEKKNKLNLYQCNKLISIKEYFETLTLVTDNSESIKSQLFTYSFNSSVNYLNQCVEKSRGDEKYFYSDFEGLFNYEKFIDFIIPPNTNYDFSNILLSLQKSILITIDGFDTLFDDYRIDKSFYSENEIEDRAYFELDWLHSLFLLINDVKQLNVGDKSLSDKVDFCISTPSDRFLEILTRDRDSYRFYGKHKILVWSGVELALFLRKRLEIFAKQDGYILDKEHYSHPFDSLAKILADKFNFLPNQITIEFNGRKYYSTLFTYVLRHTFWRPRDLLTYFSKILSLSSTLKRCGEEITSEHIKTTISDATWDIIKSEFIREYKSVIKNIDLIVEKFNDANQILNSEELLKIVDSFTIDFIVKEDKVIIDAIYKIKLLYQLGFLGLLISNDIKEEYNYKVNEIFIFSEGARLINTLSMERISKYKFIIHPIFKEFLHLKNNTDYFVLNYSITYLKELEGIMNASNHSYVVEF